MKEIKGVDSVNGDEGGKSWEGQKFVKLESENYVSRYL